MPRWTTVTVAGLLSVGIARRRKRRRKHHRHWQRLCPSPPAAPRVLIFSASVGGGHNAAAAVLRHDLQQLGCDVHVVDGLALASPRLSRVFQWAYPWQLTHLPVVYDWQIRWSNRQRIARGIRWLCARLWSTRLLDAIETFQPDIVVSTYPLVTAVLGRLRTSGKIGCPCVATVTDYGVHRLWTSPGIDLHLVVSVDAARQADDVDGRIEVMQPLVHPAFRILRDRAAARAQLGLPQHAFIALVVGGAWGIGAIEETAADVAATGVYTVIVCGRNEWLARRLERRFAAESSVRVLGWTDDLARYMAAVDCLVQNAGGLTTLEAVAARLPIVLYRPIAGHGRMNATAMERASAAVWARSPTELHALLTAAASGRVSLPAPAVESGRPASLAILSLLPAGSTVEPPPASTADVTRSC